MLLPVPVDPAFVAFSGIAVKTDKGICLANLQGSFELSKGDKVKLTSSTYPDKKGVSQPCLIVTEKV